MSKKKPPKKPGSEITTRVEKNLSIFGHDSRLEPPDRLTMREMIKAKIEEDPNYWHKLPYKLDDEGKERCVNAIMVFGTLAAGARAAGVTEEALRLRRKAEPTFNDLCNEAISIFRLHLEEEVYLRGVQGWLEPVVQKGRIVKDGKKPLMVRKYDSAIFQMFVKRHHPDYQEKKQVDVNVGGGLLVIPGSQAGGRMSREEFEKTFGGVQQAALEGDFEKLPENE